MKRCARCLYPASKPDLHFDAEGVCSACRAFDKRESIDWAARKRELEAILETGKNGSGFDCIVPSSGGKDSHYQVLTLIEMGARPLVVTATTCHLTEMGRANIDNLARYATTIEVTPNRTVRAKLNRLGLARLGDISYPEHLAIFSIPFRVACDFGIPLVFYGESPTREYGGPPGADEIIRMDRRWVSEFGGLLGMRANDFIGQEGITDADMADYRLPSDERMKNVTAYFLGQFAPWDSHRNAAVAKAAGMKQALPSPANWWDSENLDCTFTGAHDLFCWLKYGFGRSTAQLGVDIRNGRIGRDEALKIAAMRDGLFSREYAGGDVFAALMSIGVTEEEFWRIADRFTNKKIHADPTVRRAA